MWLLLGIVAGIPTALLVLSAGRQRREEQQRPMRQERPGSIVYVIQDPGTEQQVMGRDK